MEEIEVREETQEPVNGPQVSEDIYTRFARKVEIRSFLLSTLFLGLATAVVAGAALIIAFFAGVTPATLGDMINAYAFIALFFLLQLCLFRFLSSELHLNALDWLGMEMASITFFRRNSALWNARYAKIVAKIICVIEHHILVILSSIFADQFEVYFGIADETRKSNIVSSNYLRMNLGIPFFIMFVMLFYVRDKSGRNFFGEIEASNAAENQVNGILYIVATRIESVWEKSENMAVVELQGYIFVFLMIYIVDVLVRLGAAREAEGPLEFSFFSIPKYFILAVLPCYLVFLSIHVATSILCTKRKNRKSQSDLESARTL